MLEPIAMELAETPLEQGTPAELENAVCARHPERRASIVCPHCGTFACGACTTDTLWGDVMCESCRVHGRAQYPLPWEESFSPVSGLHTAYLVFADTKAVFGAFPTGRARRATAFAFLLALVIAALEGVTEWLFGARHWAADSIGPVNALLGGALRVGSIFLLVGFYATVLHLCATLLGGRANFATAWRAACYLSATQLLWSVARVVNLVLAGSAASTLLGPIMLFFTGWGLALVAEHRYGLTHPRAVATGAAATVALIGFVVLGSYAVLKLAALR